MFNSKSWLVQEDADNMVLLGALVKQLTNDLLPSIGQLESLCGWYYKFNGTGGWLHIVLDDGNTEDSSVDYCIKRAEDEGDIVAYLLAILLRAIDVNDRDDVYTLLHKSN